MSDTVVTLVEQVREYVSGVEARVLYGPEVPTPAILRGLGDEDLDRLCDAVHDEGRRRGFGSWWYE